MCLRDTKESISPLKTHSVEKLLLSSYSKIITYICSHTKINGYEVYKVGVL